MSEAESSDLDKVKQVPLLPSQGTPNPKNRIFRFGGDKPTAINLDHVTQIAVEGNRITFQFYSTAMSVDLADPEAALSVFDVVLNIWAN